MGANRDAWVIMIADRARSNRFEFICESGQGGEKLTCHQQEGEEGIPSDDCEQR